MVKSCYPWRRAVNTATKNHWLDINTKDANEKIQ